MNKKIRSATRASDGGRFNIESDRTMPVREFKAVNWRDYSGIAEGIVEKYLADKKKE